MVVSTGADFNSVRTAVRITRELGSDLTNLYDDALRSICGNDRICHGDTIDSGPYISLTSEVILSMWREMSNLITAKTWMLLHRQVLRYQQG